MAPVRGKWILWEVQVEYDGPRLMSDNFLRLIPTDPTLVPSAQTQQRALTLLRGYLPDAGQVRTNVLEE